MTCAVITLSKEGLAVARAVRSELDGCDLFVHETVPVSGKEGAILFARVTELTARIFGEYAGIVYVMPAGVVVRAVAPCLVHKKKDPAIVVVDVGHRHAVSLCSGHEGGANELAVAVSNALGAEPVISTTTEAVKGIIAGVGCRRGVSVRQVVGAIHGALDMAAVEMREVRLLASVELKKDEPGLKAAAEQLALPLRFIEAEEIRRHRGRWRASDFVEQKVNVPAVAEPCALLAGRRTRLVLPKTIFDQVTVALAQESFMWSASAPAPRQTEPTEP